MKMFYSEESMNPGKWLCHFRMEESPFKHICGSINVIAARVCGLSYAEYLRMCRDEYGAEIIGKNCRYPIPYFSSKADCDKLAKLLSDRFNYLLNNKERFYEKAEN